MNKRGAYFFVIDALIAAMVIFISLIIIFTSHNMVPESSSSLRLVEDYANFLSSTKVREFQGEYVKSLISDGNITNLDNTLLEQLTEFYYYNTTGRNTTLIMWNFTQEISKGVVPDQRSLRLYLNNTILYSRSVSSFESSSLVLSSKKLSFIRITNDTKTFIYGPVMLDIMIWV
jgi:hypothetical protein